MINWLTTFLYFVNDFDQNNDCWSLSHAYELYGQADRHAVISAYRDAPLDIWGGGGA